MNRKSHPLLLLASSLAIPVQAHHFTDEKPATLVDELLAALAHPGMHPELIAVVVVPLAVVLGVWLAARRLRR